MCEKARKALEELKTVNGKMTSETKKGLNIMFTELENTNAKISITNEKLNTVDKKVDDLCERLNIMETATAETLKIVNSINQKLTEGDVEDKAAQMDFLQRIFSSKFGKGVIIFLLVTLVASGVAVVYLVNNYKQVTEIVDSIKK